MSDPFSFKKLIASPFTGMYWIKVIMFMFGMGFILMVVRAFYIAYIHPPKTQTQAVQIINPQKGANINIGQKGDGKKSWLDPYLEVFVEGTKGIYNSDQYEGKVGVRLGLRF